MIEFEWEKKGSRADVAALLRELADSLDAGAEVALERDGWELKLTVPNELELGIELEVEDDETQLEIELTWPRGKRGSPKKTSD